MSYKDKIKAAFKPASPSTPTLAELCPDPLSKADVDARRDAAKRLMDASVAKSQSHKQVMAA